MATVVRPGPSLDGLRRRAARGTRWPSAMWIVLIIPCLLSNAGCSYTSYDIEMKTDGAVLERKLIVRHREPEVREEAALEAVANPGGAAQAGPQADDEPTDEDSLDEPAAQRELKRLAALYDKRLTPPDSEEHVFLGRFTGETPDDVGGSGSYTHLTTLMGTASAYVERFRGDDDLDAELERRMNAADQLVDLVIGWLESELQEEPGFKELQEFLASDFRRDVQNLVVYVWTAGAGIEWAGAEQAITDFAVRGAQYLIERRYFTAESLPRVARAVVDANDRNQPQPLLALLRRALAAKMGLPDDEPLPECFAFLADETALERSWEQYVARSDLYRSGLALWTERRRAAPDLEKPEPGDVVSALAVTATGFRLFAANDRLNVSLECPATPFATNGAWDDKIARVTWSGRIGQRGQEPHNVLPKVLYAFWSVPDAKFQNAHFGKTVLAGQVLAQYALWRKGLSDQEGREWDRFIVTLEPDDRLLERLDAFGFTTDPSSPLPDQDEDPTLSDTPRDLIRQGLEAESEG